VTGICDSNADRLAQIRQRYRGIAACRDVAVGLQRMACEGQLHVALWCIQLSRQSTGEEAR